LELLLVILFSQQSSMAYNEKYLSKLLSNRGVLVALSARCRP
jgi:hypothetical protein